MKVSVFCYPRMLLWLKLAHRGTTLGEMIWKSLLLQDALYGCLISEKQIYGAILIWCWKNKFARNVLSRVKYQTGANISFLTLRFDDYNDKYNIYIEPKYSLWIGRKPGYVLRNKCTWLLSGYSSRILEILNVLFYWIRSQTTASLSVKRSGTKT